jgi:hypothetical protein
MVTASSFKVISSVIAEITLIDTSIQYRTTEVTLSTVIG